MKGAGVRAEESQLEHVRWREGCKAPDDDEIEARKPESNAIVGWSCGKFTGNRSSPTDCR